MTKNSNTQEAIEERRKYLTTYDGDWDSWQEEFDEKFYPNLRKNCENPKLPESMKKEALKGLEAELSFLTQKLQQLAKQKDEEFMGILGKMRRRTSYPDDKRTMGYNQALAELRNKLQRGGRMMDSLGKSDSELKAMVLYELLTAKNITKKQKIKMLELNIEKHIEEQPEEQREMMKKCPKAEDGKPCICRCHKRRKKVEIWE